MTILRLPQVKAKTGLSKSYIYNQVALGKFPQQVELAPNIVGWVEEEVDGWLRARVRESRNDNPDSGGPQFQG